jgi:hypothetical protein
VRRGRDDPTIPKVVEGIAVAGEVCAVVDKLVVLKHQELALGTV